MGFGKVIHFRLPLLQYLLILKPDIDLQVFSKVF